VELNMKIPVTELVKVERDSNSKEILEKLKKTLEKVGIKVIKTN